MKFLNITSQVGGHVQYPGCGGALVCGLPLQPMQDGRESIRGGNAIKNGWINGVSYQASTTGEWDEHVDGSQDHMHDGNHSKPWKPNPHGRWGNGKK
jgi:hypothetical protein